MEPTIYIDVIVLVSWGMDAFLLWAAGKIAGFSARKWRIALGGFFSALVYCLWLCVGGRNGGFLLSLLLLWIGLLPAYYPKQGRNWLRLFGAELAVSFLMSGGINMLFTMTQAQRILGQRIIIQKAYPWWLLPWSVGMAYVLVKLAGNWLEANIQRRKEHCTAKILFRGKGIEGRMLIDTGNGLMEQGRGVAVVQLSAFLPLFPKEKQICFLSGDMTGLEWMAFTSLGNPDGRLYGIRAEKLILSFGEKQIIHNNIFVGINLDDFTGAYEGLVPPCLVEEE